VKITVKDQGVGIPEENLTRIFDPYFTTRDEPTKKGSGLGPAIAHSIVKKHGKKIEVENEAGRGASFFVYLPASPEKAEQEKRN
jgi:two-component system, cell cycle sensor histidine kinase and response regulator CckA